jgi:hypothetical protein
MLLLAVVLIETIKYTQDKHVLSSAAKLEIMCLIATIYMSANTNTITGEEVMGD